jgi:hypothetical protein
LALLEKLAKKEISKAQFLKLAEENFNLIPTLIEGTSSPKAIIRYGCSSVLLNLSYLYPDELYPYFNSFNLLLDSKFRPLLWNGLSILANLTAVDSKRKFDAVFERYYDNLGSVYMVTVVNVVVNSARIASSKPYLANRVAVELLKVQNLRLTPHLTEECTRVIAQKAIETFDTLMTYCKNKEPLLAFAQSHLDSTRGSLRKEAQQFIKKWQSIRLEP